MEVLQEELKKREAILKEREQMAKDKSQLEMKKMRSSQVLSKVTKHYFIVDSCITSRLLFLEVHRLLLTHCYHRETKLN